MQFRRGMRDKLEKYFDVQKDLEVVLEISGTAEYDFCCFGVDERNQLSDDRYMIFYNQLQAPNGEIVLEQKSKKGIFKVNLERLPSEIQKAETKQQHKYGTACASASYGRAESKNKAEK